MSTQTTCLEAWPPHPRRGDSPLCVICALTGCAPSSDWGETLRCSPGARAPQRAWRANDRFCACTCCRRCWRSVRQPLVPQVLCPQQQPTRCAAQDVNAAKHALMQLAWLLRTLYQLTLTYFIVLRPAPLKHVAEERRHGSAAFAHTLLWVCCMHAFLHAIAVVVAGLIDRALQRAEGERVTFHDHF